MAKILVTGSTGGIGRHTADTLITNGHQVVFHARTEDRAPAGVDVLIGDLASLAQTRDLAAQASRSAPFDVVIHNAGVGGGQGQTDAVRTEDGLERVFQVNVLAPYLLTCLLPSVSRLVYLTSGLQAYGQARLDDAQWRARKWDGGQAYADSKLYDVMLAFAVARHRPAVRSNAVDPGWIRTRMGGSHAPDDVATGSATQIWLATSDEPAALVTGRYFSRRTEYGVNPLAGDEGLQEQLLGLCADLTGVRL